METEILRIVNDRREGITTDEIGRQLNKTPQELGDEFERLIHTGKIRGFAGLWFLPKAFEEAKLSFLEALTKAHEKQPNKLWLPAEQALKIAQLRWAGKPLARILSQLESEGLIAVSGEEVRLPKFETQLPARQRQFLDRVIEALVREPINVPTPHDLARMLGAPPQAVEEILRVGAELGDVVQIAEGVYYTQAQLEALKIQIAEATERKRFSTPELRDALETTRKYVVPLLAYYDSIGFTQREGETRIVVEKS